MRFHTAVASLLLPAAAHAAPITIAETQFAPGSFDVIHITGGLGGAASFGQINNGNPAPGAVVDLEVIAGVPANGIGSWSWLLCFSTQRIIDPAIDGAIATIDGSLDSAWISGSFGPTVQSNGLAIRQRGRFYFAPLPLTSVGGWSTQSVTNVTADMFQEIINEGAQFLDPDSHPDFSAGGRPIELGFARGNSNGGGGYAGYTNAVGADNFLVTIHPCIGITTQPAPQSACTTGAATFNAQASSSAGDVTYQWQISDPTAFGGWVDIVDGALFVNGLNVGAFSGATTAQGTWQGSYLADRVPGQWNPLFRCVATASCGSAATEPAAINLCYADLNCDAFVDDADFVLFASAYNALLCEDPAIPAPCAADLNGDDLVDDSDFVLFVAAYNELLCP